MFSFLLYHGRSLLGAIPSNTAPDSKVHGAYMGSIWSRQDPGGPHVGPMIFVIWGTLLLKHSAALFPVCFFSFSNGKHTQTLDNIAAVPYVFQSGYNGRCPGFQHPGMGLPLASLIPKATRQTTTGNITFTILS